MTIQYAILGLLSWRPSSGYDLKKIIADSAALYWSGNNNQIYKTLVQLQSEGLVTHKTQHQESLPAKKIYSITDKGKAALRQWVLSTPELPEFRSTFLIQLTWADLLDNGELEALLAVYEEELRVQLAMQKEKARRQEPSSARTRREVYLWGMVDQNILSTYENELRWINNVRAGLNQMSAG